MNALTSQQDFLKILQANARTISGHKVFQHIKIDQISCTWDELRLKDCEFSSFEITNKQLSKGLRIINCKIDTLVIKNIVANGERHTYQKESGSIYIENSDINDFRLESSELDGELLILNESKIETCSLFFDMEGKKNIGGIVIESSKFNILSINNLRSKEDIIIKKSTIEKEIQMSGNNVGKCWFFDLNVNNFHLAAGIVKNSIDFEKGTYNGSFFISGLGAIKDKNYGGLNLTFKGVVFKEQVLVRFEQHDDIPGSQNTIVNNNLALATLYFDSVSFHRAIFDGANLKINRLDISGSKNLVGDIIFKYFKIESLRLSEVNNNASTITFDGITFKEIEFKNFVNLGIVRFINSQLKPIENSSFQVIDSFLGNTQFSHFDFTNFTEIEFYNSDVTEIKVSNVKWFDSKKLLVKGQRFATNLKQEDLKLYNIKCKREIYRQLKLVTEKNADKVQSIIFKSNEMSAYLEETRSVHKRYHPERFIMWLSLSNDYGINWVKPILLLLLLLTPLFYTLIVVSYDDNLTCIPSLKWDNIANTMKILYHYKKIMVQMLNPIHSLKNLFNIEEVGISGWVHFWDYFYKIVLSYLIFQTISAFRKYSKV